MMPTLEEIFKKGFQGIAAGMDAIYDAVCKATETATNLANAIPEDWFQQVKASFVRNLKRHNARQVAHLVEAEGEAVIRAVADTLNEIKAAMEASKTE